MTPTQVKRKLKEKNLTYWRLAKRWRVTSGMVSNFINGKTVSEPLQRKLAEVLGMSVEELRNGNE
jgi:plasmid maintenance system antidote protein VapI